MFGWNGYTILLVSTAHIIMIIDYINVIILDIIYMCLNLYIYRCIIRTYIWVNLNTFTNEHSPSTKRREEV